MNIVFICASPSCANGICARIIAEGFKVVGSYKAEFIYTADLSYSNITNLNRALIFLDRIIGKTSLCSILIKKIVHELNLLKPDVIIPFCLPYEGAYAAVEYKKKYSAEVKIIPFLYDEFADNNSLNRFVFLKKLKYFNNKKIEDYIIKESYLISITESTINLNKEQKALKYGFPLLSEKIKLNPVEYSFIYAGAFYKKLRNPEQVLQIMKEVVIKLNGIFNIYSSGNCNSIVDKYCLKDKVVRNEILSNEKVLEEMSKSNFLVIQGNKNTDQVPSKIIEAISFGKPIIYFYSDYNDVLLILLKKYGNAISIRLNCNIEESIDRICDFCFKNKNVIISYKEIEKSFMEYKASYIVKDLIAKL
ncbi:hypothetical protein EDC55_10858 [Allofrancisella inopinata]|uniref:Uncharacterized protein n=1 Tax=Allofrancisella inopinata TaxID=1085647 RepID=A0AAE6YHU4_9GAMM|nr:hypothetical protein [Allofrancisella inopinata]QIV95707.1 hypothetical protein E4K63_02215 [Allofrancisella inopinata]TDT72165.1 hypothetical protein EDC55_10858 [Allofrancisella inopinata]